MIDNLRRLLHCRRASDAVEAAIFAPIFLLFTLGITDLGAVMFAFMQINAAMNDAIGDPAFCMGSVCTASTGACANGDPKCIIVEAIYPYSPILPDVVYTWTQSVTIHGT